MLTIFNILIAIILGGCMFYIGKQTFFCSRWWLYLIFAIALSSDILFCNQGYSIFEFAVSTSLGLSVALPIYILTSYPIFKKSWLKIVPPILDAILLLLTITPQVIRISMGLSYFNEECFIVLLQSNIQEILSFFYEKSSILSILGFILFFITIIIASLRNNILILKHSILIASGILCICSFIFSAYLSNGIHFAQIYADNYYRKIEYLKRNINADYSIFSQLKQDSLTFVIVIGESVSRDYMSVYGYYNTTTPNLKELVSTGDLLRFNNSYSPDIKTVDCIPKALTSKSQFCESIDYILFNLFQSKGYFTAWVGNQASSGFNDNPVAILSSCANYRVFSEDIKGEDMQLLPHVKKLLNEKNQKKLIVIHLKGSHYPYDLAYPKDVECDLVKASTTLEHYENSLRYHDMFMKELISILSPYQNLICLYTSDHGEKPGVTRMNDYFDFSMVRVPFMIYFSPNLRDLESYEILKNHINCYWSNELLFNLVCGLAGIKNKEILPLDKDLSSNSYNLTKNSFTHQNGHFKMIDDCYDTK